MTQPLIATYLSDTETPVSLFYKLQFCSRTPDEFLTADVSREKPPISFLLDSADGDSRIARFSFLGVNPILSIKIRDGQALIQDHQKQTQIQQACPKPMQMLRELQELHLSHVPVDDAHLPSALRELPLIAGWVGYLGYGMTRYFEKTPQAAMDPVHVPDAYMGLYDTVIAFDHLYRRLYWISYRESGRAQQLLRQFEGLLTRSVLRSQQSVSHTMTPLVYQDLSDENLFDNVITSVSKEAYCASVKKGQDYIREGQIFQIVLAQRFSLPVRASALEIYRMLQAINPSPYAYMLYFPEFSYLGSSPEMMMRCRDGHMILRALAGTRPRGKSQQEDEQLAVELRANDKEMAEHRMLVDLGRNDLGRVCLAGSVQVGEVAQVIRYSHVMHLATEINGLLKPEKSAYEAIESCFPRGTVSGAPKIRAMELISGLEPEQRGVYSGLVGYINHRGNTDTAIAIRSALIKEGWAHVHAGAGVVYYSDPEAEYEETRNKAKSVIKALQLAERAITYE